MKAHIPKPAPTATSSSMTTNNWFFVLLSGLVLMVPQKAKLDSEETVTRDLTVLNVPVADLGRIVATEKSERDFLLKTLGLSLKQYEIILEQRSRLVSEMKKSMESGNPAMSGSRKAAQQHVEWLQSYLGADRYSQLIDLSLQELGSSEAEKA